MTSLRVALRFVGIGLWTSLSFLVWLLGRPLGWLVPSWGRASHAVTLRSWARGMAWLCGMRVVSRGTPPQPPFVLVANHLSYLDILTIWSHVQGSFLSRADVAYWPFIGVMARSVGTLFIERTRKRDLPSVVAEFERTFAKDQGVIFFPEGTSSEGQEVLPFRASLFDFAARAGHPVHCAALTYQTPPGAVPARLSVCWWGEMPFLGHALGMLRLPRIDATIEFSEEPVRALDRKALAELTHSAVRARFLPVTAGISE